METNLLANNQNRMRTQVARSKGTEWMVSSYNAWQERSPLQSVPKRNPSATLLLASMLDQKGNQFNRVLTLSVKSIIFIIGILLLVKSR